MRKTKIMRLRLSFTNSRTKLFHIAFVCTAVAHRIPTRTATDRYVEEHLAVLDVMQYASIGSARASKCAAATAEPAVATRTRRFGILEVWRTMVPSGRLMNGRTTLCHACLLSPQSPPNHRHSLTPRSRVCEVARGRWAMGDGRWGDGVLRMW